MFTKRLFKPALIATAAAMSVAVLPAGAAQAKTIRHLVSIDRCAPVYADRPISAQNLNVVELSVNCLINRGRAEAGAPPLTRPFSTDANGGLSESTPLYNSALAHAQQSVAAKSWDLNNGLVSHLNPGTPVPSDGNQLQQLVNTQINDRIRGAGYCAGGHSWRDAENTYGGVNITPRMAADFWLHDPSHRPNTIDPNLKEHRIAVVVGSAFPGLPDAGSAALVEDMGACS